ncbi:tetratricopeptide repeat protein [Nocardia sp. CDC160]|uniref:tetratricopeptide repeat protein n=1 Tax=Nocardia sp. CDC160 TaxID=3112166 RepID=UPI002DB83891|nr:tetratricopeptide repeat protein [Nocardia sp. CDC160]MEC3920551.1 tetratricopeptide repeat protein [Nocardia sp. CDC160]
MSYPVESVELRDRGLAAVREGNLEAAEQLLRQAFEAGHAGAANDLADLLLRRGDREEAIRWWHRGAESGDPECLFELGYVEEAAGDLAAAERWYRRGVEIGGTGSLLNLANILEGRGERDEAMELYRRAWAAGNDKAAFNLGRIYDDGGRGDQEAAELWYARAAERGNAGAAFNLGFVRGDRGDVEGMLDAWRRAAGFGHPRAGHALADHYGRRGALAQARYWSEFADGPRVFSPEFEAFGGWGAAAAIHRQDLLNEFLGDDYVHYDLDARTFEVGENTYGGVTFLGSFSNLDQSWLWSWNNSHFDPAAPALAAVERIREYGAQQGIPEFICGRLDMSNFPNPKQAATIMAIAAASLLGGNGVNSVGINNGKGSTYVHLDDPRLPADEYDPIAAPRLLMTAAEVFPADHALIVRGLLTHYGPSLLQMSQEAIIGELPGGHRLAVEFTERGLIKAISSDPARPDQDRASD